MPDAHESHHEELDYLKPPMKEAWTEKLEDPNPEAVSDLILETLEDQKPKSDIKLLEKKVESVDEFLANYCLGYPVGNGGFGIVYSSSRKSDDLPVAIKFIPNHPKLDMILTEKDTEPVPLEVELMRRVCRAPTCPGIIQLLDWFVGPSVVILVLERPLYCTDLQVYIKSKPGGLNESKARRIFRQVVEVMWHCQSRGVFHNDLKAENILIQRKSKQIKLIDFGCGFILQDEAYKKLRGTVQNFPPEVFRKKCYKAVPATSWSLGLLLFNMLCGEKPFVSKKEILQGIFQYKRFISRDCKILIEHCLSPSADRRPTLEEIFSHPWMKRKSLLAPVIFRKLQRFCEGA